MVFSFGSGYCAPSYYPWYGGYYGYPGYAYYSYYPSYSATLRTVEGNEVPLAGNLKPTGPPSAGSVVVSLPPATLRKGDYQVRLYSPAPERVATYQFRVVE